MNAKLSILTATLVALLAAGPAAAVDPTHNGALATPANRIVGLWLTEGAVGPCSPGSPPNQQVRNTLMFSAGGTVVENPRSPPQGIALPSGLNQRTFSLGTWSYDPLTAVYTLHLRFDWYVDGAYNGYSTVDREMSLSGDGTQVSGPVVSTRYAANGTPMAQVCGSAVSVRE